MFIFVRKFPNIIIFSNKKKIDFYEILSTKCEKFKFRRKQTLKINDIRNFVEL